ncbi:toxin-activating lysine-acyltransferase [Rhodomicrobium sp. Az07]|nr:toxin-activating lysine-acyltransferase [Rhodomicrobium sp. Az07]MBT3071897.1 toxin-activating lysine-acyltransferase [Rhodomicrobium sp. Az07]
MTSSERTDPTKQHANGDANPSSSPTTGGSPFTLPTPGGKDKTVATLLGEVCWLFSQSPKHKNFFISDLEWLVMTPILLRQIRVFYAPDRPIGVALWAFVNDLVEERLKSGHARLAPRRLEIGQQAVARGYRRPLRRTGRHADGSEGKGVSRTGGEFFGSS